MLELTGGEAFGVQVGDFLEFQCAFQGHRVADVTAEEQHRAGVLHVAAELLDLFFVVNNFLDLVGNLPKFLKCCIDFVGEHVAAKLCKVQAEEVYGSDLCQECLGGCHGDFRACVGVQGGIGFAGDGGAVGVTDGNHLGTLFPGVAHGHEGVHGFAGLG